MKPQAAQELMGDSSWALWFLYLTNMIPAFHAARRARAFTTRKAGRQRGAATTTPRLSLQSIDGRFRTPPGPCPGLSRPGSGAPGLFPDNAEQHVESRLALVP